MVPSPSSRPPALDRQSRRNAAATTLIACAAVVALALGVGPATADSNFKLRRNRSAHELARPAAQDEVAEPIDTRDVVRANESESDLRRARTDQLVVDYAPGVKAKGSDGLATGSGALGYRPRRANRSAATCEPYDWTSPSPLQKLNGYRPECKLTAE